MPASNAAAIPEENQKRAVEFLKDRFDLSHSSAEWVLEEILQLIHPLPSVLEIQESM
jgi:hypothetical protein